MKLFWYIFIWVSSFVLNWWLRNYLIKRTGLEEEEWPRRFHIFVWGIIFVYMLSLLTLASIVNP